MSNVTALTVAVTIVPTVALLVNLTPQPLLSNNEQVHAMVSSEDDTSSDEGTMLTQNSSVIGDTKILLDNQSTINQFATKDLLTNIRMADCPVRVFCNAGSTVTKLEGDLGNFPVFYNADSIANILSLKDAQRHRVTYDSWDRDGVFIVHTPKGLLEFECHPTVSTVLILPQSPLPTLPPCS